MKKTIHVLTSEDVKKIARLARIPLNDEEVKRFTPQLSEVLHYFNKLNELDTESIEPTYSTAQEENRFQEIPLGSETLNREDVLKNANEKKNGYILTKAVIENLQP